MSNALAWVMLIAAGICEMGWPLGFKLAAQPDRSSLFWFVFSGVSMVVSGALLFWAQKVIPIGTAYVVWTGVGGVGTALVGMYFFGDPATTGRLVSLFLVIAGIIGLKVFS